MSNFANSVPNNKVFIKLYLLSLCTCVRACACMSVCVRPKQLGCDIHLHKVHESLNCSNFGNSLFLIIKLCIVIFDP